MFIMIQNESTGHLKGTWKQGSKEAKHSLYNYKEIFYLSAPFFET